MIRTFDLRDLALVSQIENQGTPLYAELALTRHPRPLQSALAGFFSLSGHGLRTYVLREDNDEGKLCGLIQLRDRRDHKYSVITFIAPAAQVNHHSQEVWGHLLDYAAVHTGKLGVQHIVAEVPDESEAIEVLHRAGYAIYVRQDIYRLGRPRDTVLAEPLLRACQSSDEWGVHQLYHNTVPRLAQLADGAPRMYRSGAVRGYVLEDHQEIAAYLQVRRGPDGAWFSLLVHPRAEARAAAIVEYGLSLFGSNWNAPLYCGVRRYQEWLSRPLETLGFEHHGSTVIMVKHLVNLIQEPETTKVPGLEKVTAPLAHPRG
jgi:RimJ/RimL family protein N-acetyltransferase